ncbi:ATP-binding protein [Streptomyces sp. NBC_00727]|uniref:ATP-binding protein n=1 Tax=Streptomyces sp. NBC_00727 TaxID=2903675 RepID=UPI00386E3AC9
MHSLFHMPADQITFAMVQDFVGLRIPENLRIEYKTSGDKSLEGIAAMANTNGGILFYGVSEGKTGVPEKIVGAPHGTREALVNKMATIFDPPWTPEVIEIPIDGSSDKVVLLVRIDPVQVPRPLLHQGTVYVRLEGRNERATRLLLLAMLTEPAKFENPLPQLVLHLPRQYEVPPQGDLVLRAVANINLHMLRGRHRLPRGTSRTVVEALEQSPINEAVYQLMFGRTDVEPATSPWVPIQATATRVRLAKEYYPTSPDDVNVDERINVYCTVKLHGAQPLLEVVLDVVADLAQGDTAVFSDIEKALPSVARSAAAYVLPRIAQAATGLSGGPDPTTSVFVSGPPADLASEHQKTRYQRSSLLHRNARDLALYVDFTSLGERVGRDSISHGAAEVLPYEINELGWGGAVREALITMAMDWGFTEPRLLQHAKP